MPLNCQGLEDIWHGGVCISDQCLHSQKIKSCHHVVMVVECCKKTDNSSIHKVVQSDWYLLKEKS